VQDSRAIGSQFPTLRSVRLLVRANVLGKRLADNPRSTVEDIAAHENMGEPCAAARLIRLNFLARDIVAAIRDGK
jgi:ribose 1,5-bisphosphokinase PhnN